MMEVVMSDKNIKPSVCGDTGNKICKDNNKNDLKKPLQEKDLSKIGGGAEKVIKTRVR
jgi:hypothetical protein